jgi:hypothetical protein
MGDTFSSSNAAPGRNRHAIRDSGQFTAGEFEGCRCRFKLTFSMSHYKLAPNGVFRRGKSTSATLQLVSRIF